jgi:hypothetical protein
MMSGTVLTQKVQIEIRACASNSIHFCLMQALSSERFRLTGEPGGTYNLGQFRTDTARARFGIFRVAPEFLKIFKSQAPMRRSPYRA